jgi:membrane protein DedA with SNARE-associated domain
MSVHLVDIQGSLSALTGVGLVAANVLADQLGLPVPALPALVLAGALAAKDVAWACEVFAASVAAATVADSLWYVAGRRFGHAAVRILCVLSLTPEKCVNDTELRFNRWGGFALIFSKFVPGLSVVAPPLAGALRMPWWRFLPATIVASALWAGALLLVGMLMGRQVRQLLSRITPYGGVVLVAAALAVAIYLGLRWYQKYRLGSPILRRGRPTISREQRDRQQT